MNWLWASVLEVRGSDHKSEGVFPTTDSLHAAGEGYNGEAGDLFVAHQGSGHLDRGHDLHGEGIVCHDVVSPFIERRTIMFRS